MSERLNGIGTVSLGIVILAGGYSLLFSVPIAYGVLTHVVVLGGWLIVLFGLIAYLAHNGEHEARRVFQVGGILSVLGLAGVMLANFLVMTRVLPERHQLFQLGVSVTIAGLSLLLLGSFARRGALQRLRVLKWTSTYAAQPSPRWQYKSGPLQHEPFQWTQLIMPLMLLIGSVIVVWGLAQPRAGLLLRLSTAALGLLFVSHGCLAASLLRIARDLRELQRSNAELMRQLSQRSDEELERQGRPYGG